MAFDLPGSGVLAGDGACIEPAALNLRMQPNSVRRTGSGCQRGPGHRFPAVSEPVIGGLPLVRGGFVLSLFVQTIGNRVDL